MIDARTAVLVGTAILSPYLLTTAVTAAAGAGVPVQVYITGGQTAALAALNANAVGTSQADTQSIVSLIFAGAGKLPTMNGSDAADLAQRLLNACNAGAAAATEPYQLQQTLDGFAGVVSAGNTGVAQSMPRSDLGNAYDALKAALVVSDESLTNATDISPAILDLATEMDAQGYLVTGKPVTVSIAGGLGAAASATASWAADVAGDAAGVVVGKLAGVLLSTPALILISGLILYRVVKR